MAKTAIPETWKNKRKEPRNEDIKTNSGLEENTEIKEVAEIDKKVSSYIDLLKKEELVEIDKLRTNLENLLNRLNKKELQLNKEIEEAKKNNAESKIFLHNLHKYEVILNKKISKMSS